MNTQALDQLASALVAGGKPFRPEGKEPPKGARAKAKPKAAPAKAASAPVAVPNTPPKATPVATAKAAQPAPAATRYALGKPFVAKAGGKYAQAENWAVVAGLLAKSPATREELITALRSAAEKGGYMDRENAAGFVQGRIRGGHIVVAE